MTVWNMCEFLFSTFRSVNVCTYIVALSNNCYEPSEFSLINYAWLSEKIYFYVITLTFMAVEFDIYGCRTQ